LFNDHPHFEMLVAEMFIDARPRQQITPARSNKENVGESMQKLKETHQLHRFCSRVIALVRAQPASSR
jgi:hypothetical protein